jgi:hypothetical protein
MTEDEKNIKIEEEKMTMHRRNTQSVELKLKEIDNLYREQQQQIVNLNNYVATLEMRFNHLEQRMTLEKVMKYGTGPSVKD